MVALTWFGAVRILNNSCGATEELDDGQEFQGVIAPGQGRFMIAGWHWSVFVQ